MKKRETKNKINIKQLISDAAIRDVENQYKINIEQILSDDFIRFSAGYYPYYTNIKKTIYTIIHNLSFERKLGERLEDVLKKEYIETKSNKTAIPFNMDWFLLNKNLLKELENHGYIPTVNSGYVYSLFPDITLTPKDKDYPLFFSLKLNMLELDDIDNFLDYIFKNNFNNDFKKFKRFLGLRFRGDKEIISVDNIETTKEWIESDNGETENKIIKETSLTNGVNEAETELPKGYSKIAGKLTKEQINKFFSFLYEEKGRDGKPFLPKQEVEELIKIGLALPNAPRKKMFSLNITSHQKGLIKYCFYKLYECHKEDVFIKEDFTKYLAYTFQQFSPNKNVDIIKYIKNLSKNITGEKPAKIKFEIKTYLP